MDQKPERKLIITIGDLMTRKVVMLREDAPLKDVVEAFITHDVNGFPVVDAEGVLKGIVTQYDLVVRGSGVHIPTLLKTLNEVKMISAERGILKDTLKPLYSLTAKDIMNPEALCLYERDPMEKATQEFAEHHKVNPIVVLNEAKKVVGVLSRHDMIRILAEKDLGRAVAAAAERKAGGGVLEKVAGGTMAEVQRGFLFAPQYKVRRWVAFSVALFLIGAATSFLFVVKAPRISEPSGSLPPGKGVVLSIRGPSSVKLGSEAEFYIYLSAAATTTLERASAKIAYDRSRVEFRRAEDTKNEIGTYSTAKFVDLNTSALFFDWISSGGLVLPGKQYEMGKFTFQTTAEGDTTLHIDVVSPASDGSFAFDNFGQNVLSETKDLNLSVN